MAELLCELGVQTRLEMHKKRNTETKENKKKSRYKPGSGASTSLTGRSFADIL